MLGFQGPNFLVFLRSLQVPIDIHEEYTKGGASRQKLVDLFASCNFDKARSHASTVPDPVISLGLGPERSQQQNSGLHCHPTVSTVPGLQLSSGEVPRASYLGEAAARANDHQDKSPVGNRRENAGCPETS